MEVEFICDGNIVHKSTLTEKIKLPTNSFSIPISVSSSKDDHDNFSSQSIEFLNKKTERNEKKNDEEIIINTNLIQKKKKYDYDEESEEEEENNEEESEEYEESNELSSEIKDNKIKNMNDEISITNSNNMKGDYSETSSKYYSSQRLLRKYGTITDKDNEFYGLGGSGNKKVKRELTEEEIAKKTEQARLRKLHAKKLIEEEKREAVERILNEDGRKLRERQKKQNEEIKKKNQMEKEKSKKNLTKIITKYSKDGKIYVRFPQGFLLPSIFNQQKKEIKSIIKCHVEGCENYKKYTDPKTGFPYCSVECFKILRNQSQLDEKEEQNGKQIQI